MDSIQVILDKRIPFKLIQVSEGENIIFCKKFTEQLFDTANLSTKEKDFVHNYISENNQKYIITDVNTPDGKTHKNIKFKVVLVEKGEIPYSTFNPKGSNVILEKVVLPENKITDDLKILEKNKSNDFDKKRLEQIEERLENKKNRLINEEKQILNKKILLKEEKEKAIQEQKEKENDLQEKYKIIREAKNDIIASSRQYLEEKLKASSEENKNYARRILELGGGGGSVATQYANGGTMNGNLNVNGNILSGGVNLLNVFSGGGGGGLTDRLVNGSYQAILSSNGNLIFPTGSKISRGYPGLPQDDSSWFVAPTGQLGGLVSADGEQYIQLGDNSPILIGTGWPDSAHEWTFGTDGTTLFPNQAIDGGTAPIELKSRSWSQLTYNNIDMTPAPNKNHSTTFFVEGGDALLEIFRWDNSSVLQHRQWTFSSDGSLTFPDNTIQTTAFTGNPDSSNLYVKLSGDTMTGGLSAPSLSAGNILFVNQTSFRSISTTNLFIGDGTTGNNTASGNHNFAFGRCAGAALRDGSHNTFFGQYAGRSNTTGSCNVFIGQSAGSLNTTGGFNILIGPTGGGLRTGSCNIMIGRANGLDYGVGTGSGNIFMGNSSGRVNTTGTSNTFIGQTTGRCNSTGSCNVFIGQNAGFNNTTGNNNNFFGDSAGFNTTGNNNVSFGSCAGSFVCTGNNNTFIGANANTINAATSALNGVLVLGAGAIATQTNQLVLSTANISIRSLSGTQSGIVPGSPNLFIGSENTAFGAGNDAATGSHNFIFGSCAANRLTDGSHNVVFGHRSGFCITTSSNNNFLGNAAGRCITGGSENNFFGSYAGACGTGIGGSNMMGRRAGQYATGSSNNFFGCQAGNRIAGSHNNFIGYRAGNGPAAGQATNNTANNNNFFGNRSGYRITTGSCNVFIGMNAGCINTSGVNNTFIGRYAGCSNIIGNNNIIIGNVANVTTDVVNGLSGWSNTVVIGNSATATADNQLVIGSVNSTLTGTLFGRLAVTSLTNALSTIGGTSDNWNSAYTTLCDVSSFYITTTITPAAFPNGYTFSDADNTKTFHVDTTTASVSVLLPNNLSNGFSVTLIALGTNALQVSSTQTPMLCANGTRVFLPYSSTLLYKFNNLVWGLGSFT